MQGMFLSIDQTFLILMQRAYWRSSRSEILFSIVLLSTVISITTSIIDVSKCDYIAIVKCLRPVAAHNRIVLKNRGIHSIDHSLRVVRG